MTDTTINAAPAALPRSSSASVAEDGRSMRTVWERPHPTETGATLQIRLTTSAARRRGVTTYHATLQRVTISTDGPWTSEKFNLLDAVRLPQVGSAPRHSRAAPDAAHDAALTALAGVVAGSEKATEWFAALGTAK